MELKNTFIGGKMNKDIDERLVPKGEYTHAENIRMGSSDSSDVGAIENVRGNKILEDRGLTNARTIGALADDSSRLLYWFVTSDEYDEILEYDEATGITDVVMSSSKAGDNVLNFSSSNLITGVNKIINGDSTKDLLAWVDNLNNNRIINIAYAKANWATKAAVGTYVEADITVIKKPPAAAPTAVLSNTSTGTENNLRDKFLAFAYRYKYKDGFISALSSFTNYQFLPAGFDINYQIMENEGMSNLFNLVTIGFNTGTDKVTDIELVFKASGSNKVNLIEKFNKAEQGWGVNETQTFLFSNDKKYTSLPKDELNRTYDNVPRLSGAQELIGSRLSYGNNLEGYNMEAPLDGTATKNDYTVSLNSTPLTIGETPVPTYFQAKATYDLDGIDLTEGKILNFGFLLNELLDGVPTDGTYTGINSYILLETFADVNALVADTNFQNFITAVMTNTFEAGYASDATGSAGTPSAFFTNNPTATTFELWTPVVSFTTPNEISTWNYDVLSTFVINEEDNQTSVKSNRSYEIGKVYIDEYGRKSTVETTANNTIFVGSSLSTSSNKIVTTINTIPPYWAESYKLVFKQNKGDYNNIFANIFYSDGNFVWVKLEGTNIGKVKEGDLLIVKSDLNGPVSTLIETRVLAIESKEEDFIPDNETPLSEDIIELAGLYMKLKPSGFDISLDGKNSRNFEAYTEDGSITYTHPYFNLYGEAGEPPATFVTPMNLLAGSVVQMDMYVDNGTVPIPAFNKQFRVNNDYIYQFTGQEPSTIAGRLAPIVQWFNAEVVTFPASFYEGTNTGTVGAADRRGDGWDFKDNGESFWVQAFPVPLTNRIVSIKWNILASEGTAIFETTANEIDTDIYYESEETFAITSGNHEGNTQNQDVTEQTSGVLVIGETYRIKDWVSPDDFTNIGGTNVDGNIFVATGTTPTTWANLSVIDQPAVVESSFFNCFAFYNGLESYAYRDTLNGNRLNIDLRPSAVSVERYSEVRRYADITYSEPYNENTSLNGLNEFNLSKANYKEDIEKKYGTIKKLYSRDTDLVVFQEDKVSRVLFGKDILTNADGTTNVTSIEDVLGQQVAYTGEYGISDSPESFAFDGNNIYWANSKNGAVLRLGANGITDISDTGLRTWFKDKFKISDDVYKLGAFDPYYDQYIVSFGTGGALLGEDENTLSFDERAKGWTSFHTFRPDYMIGMNNSLYSFDNGNLYIHHDPDVDSNQYYGSTTASKVSVMVNDSPSDIKELQAVSQEASNPWAVFLKAYKNNIDDFSTSTIYMSEFVEKEGHWFAYARRNEDTNHLDSKSTYGIGEVGVVSTNSFIYNGGSALLTAGDSIIRGSDLAIIGVVLTDIDNVITMTTPAFVTTPVDGDFIFGQKNSRIEGGNLRGYTIGVDLEITSPDKVELFAVNLEVMQSKP